MRAMMAIVLLCLLASCGGSSENIDTTGNPEVPVDSTETVVENPEAGAEVREYSTIEDYARITSREQLVTEFGSDNLVDGESWYAEGSVRFDHTVLTDPVNGQIVKYLWKEDGNTLSAIEVCYYIFDEDYSILGRQEVPSECGVSTGMSLQDLREWNGGDFDFFGFRWDYEGAILVEDGSRISECPVLIKLSLYLEVEDPDEYSALWSDQVFNTADDAVQGAPILIDKLTYYPDRN